MPQNSRSERVQDKWKITQLEDRPGYFLVELMQGDWAGLTSSRAYIVDPLPAIAANGPEGVELVGIRQIGPNSFIFADAKRLNQISDNWNLSSAKLSTSHPDTKFLVRFYEGNPTSRELVERFVLKMEWPMLSKGDLALHDWTTHALVNLTDNKLLIHARNQMAELVNFQNFVRANQKRFADLSVFGESSDTFMSYLTEAYGAYLDTLMATPNLYYKATPGTIHVNGMKAILTPAELFDELVSAAKRGGGDNYQKMSDRWGDAISSYKRQRTPPPETTYDLTVENIQAGVRNKLGKAAK